MELIRRIERTTAGIMDFYDIPKNYSTFVVKGAIRSAEAGTTNTHVRIMFNNQTTAANYFSQHSICDDAVRTEGEIQTPFSGYAPAANSPANHWGFIEATVVGGATSDETNVITRTGIQQGNSNILIAFAQVTNQSNTASLTDINIRPDLGSGFVGYLELWGS